MNHNPSLNLFRLLWVAASFGMCAWSASPVIAQAQGESLSQSVCLSGVENWIVTQELTSRSRQAEGGVGDGAGSKTRTSTITRSVSVPTGSRLVSKVTRVQVSKLEDGRVLGQSTTQDDILVEKVSCDYSFAADKSILVASNTWKASSEKSEEAQYLVDLLSRDVVALNVGGKPQVRLGYDARPNTAMTPQGFEQAVYDWATTLFTNPLSGADRDGVRRVFYNSEKDADNNINGRPYFQTIYYRKDPKTRQGAIRKIEMCFAEVWSHCVSSSANPPTKWVTQFKPQLKSPRPGVTAIAIWTDEISVGQSKKTEVNRIRSEILELDQIDFKVVSN